MSPHATSWRDPPKPVVTLAPLPADPRVIPLRTHPAPPSDRLVALWYLIGIAAVVGLAAIVRQ